MKRKEVFIMRRTFTWLQEMNLKLIRKRLRSKKMFEEQGWGLVVLVMFSRDILRDGDKVEIV